MPGAAIREDVSDEALMRELASGQQDAIGPLYARYAPTVLGMAAQALGRPMAEEIVQDVFLAVWKNASTFDPKHGSVRPWLLQIARYRIANEVRRSRRRPRTEPDSDGLRLASLPDPRPDQSQEAWNAYRRSALARALEQLPPPQRRALGLAFFGELSHDEIAKALELPLGTAKSRIRAGLRALRTRLAPLVAALAVITLAGVLAIRLRSGHAALARDERALSMLTSSDAQTLRMTAPGQSHSIIHGIYRFRSGSPIAVVTLSYFPAAPAGRIYRAWALQAGRWIHLGSARPDAQGHARLIREDAALTRPPQVLEVTLEPERSPALAPGGKPLVVWPGRSD